MIDLIWTIEVARAFPFFYVYTAYQDAVMDCLDIDKEDFNYEFLYYMTPSTPILSR